MKKLLLIILCSFTITSIAQGMDYEQKGKSYFKNVALIDKKHDQQRKNKWLIASCFPREFIFLNKLKLKTIEHSLRAEEQRCINTLLQKSGITQEQINETLNIIQQVQQARKEYLSQPTKRIIIHDPELSEEINLIKQRFAKQGFIGDNISIIKNLNMETSAKNSQMVNYRKSFNDANYRISIFSDIIQFNPLYIDDDNDQKAPSLHEAEHSIQGHGSIQSVIESCLMHFTQNDNITTLKEYNNLSKIHEQQADTFPSLDDAKSATIMRNARREGYYPETLYDEHYALLSEIDETHKIIAHLKKTQKKQYNFKPTFWKSKQMPQIKPSKFFLNLNQNNA